MNSNRKTIAALLVLVVALAWLWRTLQSEPSLAVAARPTGEVNSPPSPEPEVNLARPEPAPPRPEEARPRPVVNKETSSRPATTPSPPPVEAAAPEPEAPVSRLEPTLRPSRTELKLFEQKWNLEVDLGSLPGNFPSAMSNDPETSAELSMESTIQVRDQYQGETLGIPPLLRRTLLAGRESTTWTTPEAWGMSPVTARRSSSLLGKHLPFRWSAESNEYEASIPGRARPSPVGGPGVRHGSSRGAADDLVEDMDLRDWWPAAVASGQSWVLGEKELVKLLRPGGDWRWEAEQVQEAGAAPEVQRLSLLRWLTSVDESVELELMHSGALSGQEGDSLASFDFSYEIDHSEPLPQGERGGAPPIEVRMKGEVSGSGRLVWEPRIRRFKSVEAEGDVQVELRSTLETPGTGEPLDIVLPIQGTMKLKAICTEVQ